MPLRFRRKRILLLILPSIFIFIYFINYHTENLIANDDDLHHENEVKNTVSILSTIREQFVEIDGKKLRKIDWHDYEFIARENARTGILIDLFFLRFDFFLFFIRIR